MMKADESFVRGARLAVGEEAASAGTIIATATAASTARPALASHMLRQSLSVATRAADTAMPMPTPEKCSADKPLRPVAASRSSTRAELKIRQKALAMPAPSRSTRKNASDVVTAIATRQTAFSARPASSQARREPGRRTAASKAPAR